MYTASTVYTSRILSGASTGVLTLIRDEPLENLWGGGRAKYKKNIREGKIK